MNKDKQILILTQKIELLEKQNEDLRTEKSGNEAASRRI